MHLHSPGPQPRVCAVEVPVGAGNCVTLYDLGVFVDRAAEPVAPQDPDARARSGCCACPGGRFLLQCAVWPVLVVSAARLRGPRP